MSSGVPTILNPRPTGTPPQVVATNGGPPQTLPQVPNIPPIHTAASTSQPYLPQSQAVIQSPIQYSQAAAQSPIQHSQATPQPPTLPQSHQWPATNTTGAPIPMMNIQIPQYAPQYAPNHQGISRKEADRQPWRHRGYPAFSKWMASDDDFFVLRRFGDLSARVALHLQDQIVRLEEDLQHEDQVCRLAPDAEADSGTFRLDPRPKRGRILTDLASHLGYYQRFILDHTNLKAQPNATPFQTRNVSRWLRNAINPIEGREVEFINKANDLIPVVPKERTPLRRFLDKFDLLRLISCLRERKMNERLYDASDFEMETTVYNRDAVLDKFVTCAVMILGLAMLIGPLWWLQHLSAHQPNLQARLEVITGFLVVFTILLSILTVAKPFEVLAATAAYGAVLMVFMQLGSGGGVG